MYVCVCARVCAFIKKMVGGTGVCVCVCVYGSGGLHDGQARLPWGSSPFLYICDCYQNFETSFFYFFILSSISLYNMYVLVRIKHRYNMFEDRVSCHTFFFYSLNRPCSLLPPLLVTLFLFHSLPDSVRVRSTTTTRELHAFKMGIWYDLAKTGFVLCIICCGYLRLCVP